MLDPTGAILPGVEVTITNAGKGLSRQTLVEADRSLEPTDPFGFTAFAPRQFQLGVKFRF